MKNKPIVTGIVAALSPVPLILFTVIWSWIWFFGIGIGCLHYDTVPVWIDVVGMLPLCISPALGVIGIIHGIVRIRTRRAWLGILLSVMGLAENGILLWGMYYIGSRF